MTRYTGEEKKYAAEVTQYAAEVTHIAAQGFSTNRGRNKPTS